ncbi:Uma2 family endonuclease [Streptomyces palmae]|uniref:Uma2 family endonuclease n=2 Tax=Streptomyces palmae TaxID=1701085 RepID=A0A4Z0G9K9_9ACTN|nr:Uma2 family endonuclease [Streptomyces palmae]TGA92649.1 Uma2 family endonuclease [Streptomyces palmae]
MVGSGCDAGRHTWHYLVRTWQGLDVPDGWRAEIHEGRITLQPPPRPWQHLILGRVHRAFHHCLPEGLGIFQILAVRIASVEKVYVPNLVVIDRAVVIAESEKQEAAPVDAAEALLVCEVTSQGNARDDRTKKLWAYAHAPVPLYLLIDRWHEGGPTVTLFSDPSGGVYQSSVQVPFGKPVELPEPFGIELDTAVFSR